jgi:hypothetical protein
MTLPPNRTNNVLSVHEARHALGQRLRELRQQAGLTGRQVADSLSWPASKVSKLENGRQTPTDAVRTRVRRQEILYQPDKRFHFILTEATLRYRLCPPEVMLGQLDRLVTFAALPNVRLGIIGFETAYVVAPTHGFWLLDNDRVMVETFSVELNLAQPQEIELYSGIFEQMAAVASYGRAARAIVTRVIDDLAPEAPEDGS